jgi:hypothetical protein
MFTKILIATDLSEASERVICTLGSMKVLGTRERPIPNDQLLPEIQPMM